MKFLKEWFSFLVFFSQRNKLRRKQSKEYDGFWDVMEVIGEHKPTDNCNWDTHMNFLYSKKKMKQTKNKFLSYMATKSLIYDENFSFSQ